MPVHARTKVRDAAVSLLTGLPATADRVYVGRTRPTPEGHGDLLLVYARETITRVAEQGDPATLLHELTLFVEARVSVVPSADPDDDPARDTEERLDVIELQVTAALLGRTARAAFAEFGAPVHDVALRRTTLAAQAPGSRHEGENRIEFAVQFFTPENDLSSFA